jgi:spermidine synthase
MTKLNNNSLNNSKLKVIQADAFEWLRNQAADKYDAIIIDFPDPSNYSVGKLYTLSFYKSLQRVMTNRTLAVMQSTSPLYAKESFWCINSTIEASYLQTLPYHTYVPSFGEWGYILFAYDLNNLKTYPLPKKLKYYSNEEFKAMKYFPADMQDHKKVINRLDNQALIPLFEKEWDSLFD